jgi:HSP20 family molecular chaperone IbpA
MTAQDLSRLMWGDALSLLDRADRLHRQFFRPAAARVPTWEPPVDVLETADAVRVVVALPGVAPETVKVVMKPDAIIVSARRAFPLSSRESECGARIHSLEIPHGRFERSIGLPMQALSLMEKRLQDGCLTIIFSRKESA